jgi:hypothetical protein
VTGCNEDEAAADSNGAGKSALVMAPLWALTGRSDARSEVMELVAAPGPYEEAILLWCLVPCAGVLSKGAIVLPDYAASAVGLIDHQPVIQKLVQKQARH